MIFRTKHLFPGRGGICRFSRPNYPSNSSANFTSSPALSRASLAMAFSQPWGGGRLFGWSGANLAWRTVCTETPAATAMSSWAGQAVSESVAIMKFIKSMALLTVSVVYIIIDCQG